MNDRIENPKHYKRAGVCSNCGADIEAIDLTEHYDFCDGNSLKYVIRAGLKEEVGLNKLEKKLEDYKKARWYLNRKILTLEKELHENLKEQDEDVAAIGAAVQRGRQSGRESCITRTSNETNVSNAGKSTSVGNSVIESQWNSTSIPYSTTDGATTSTGSIATVRITEPVVFDSEWYTNRSRDGMNINLTTDTINDTINDNINYSFGITWNGVSASGWELSFGKECK